jgi:hypothetical protein
MSRSTLITLLLSLVLAWGCGLSEKRVLEGHPCHAGDPIAGAVVCQTGLRCVLSGPYSGFCLRACTAAADCHPAEICLAGGCRPACGEALPACQATEPPSCTDLACFTSPDAVRACCRVGVERGCLSPYQCSELGGSVLATDGGAP